MIDKHAIADAINYLVEAPNYSRIINELTQIVEQWDEHPMAYGGKLTMLNSLLEVGLTNRDAFERLLKLAEERRKLVPRARRTDYQRNLMRERRARIAKAREIVETTTGKPMNAEERKDHRKSVLARWADAREEFIKDKGKLDWKGRNQAAGEFWEMVDRQLDENLKVARKKAKA